MNYDKSQVMHKSLETLIGGSSKIFYPERSKRLIMGQNKKKRGHMKETFRPGASSVVV